jgi:hypothetical protein
MKKVTLIVLPFMLMAGCNGGGSGDSSSSSASLSYSGITTQANIDSDNAEYFATGSFNAGQSTSSSTGSSLSGVVSNDGSAVPITKPSSVSIVKVLQKPIRNINVDSIATPSFSGAVYEENFSEECTGGGTVSGSLSSTDAGNFNGTMVFGSCTEDGETVSGSTTVSGTADTNTGDILTITITSDSLTVSSTDTNITMDGSVAYTFSGNDIHSTSNLVIRDNKVGKTNKMENFVLRLTENIGYDELYLSGKYYDSQYGYGDVHTFMPFLIADGDYWPYSGEAEVLGDNGSSVTITAVNNTEYTMTVYGSDGSIVSTTEAWQFPFQL